jgi:hypothetical protein
LGAWVDIAMTHLGLRRLFGRSARLRQLECLLEKNFPDNCIDHEKQQKYTLYQQLRSRFILKRLFVKQMKKSERFPFIGAFFQAVEDGYRGCYKSRDDDTHYLKFWKYKKKGDSKYRKNESDG